VPHPVYFVPDGIRSEWMGEFRRDMNMAQWEASCKVSKCVVDTGEHGGGGDLVKNRSNEDRHAPEEIP
jgi:hypothetical protein